VAKDPKKSSSILKWEVAAVAVIIIAGLIYLLLIWTPSGAPISTMCLPQTGYQCSSSIIYHYSTGNATLLVGQTTGINWTSASIYFVPQGTQNINGTPITIIQGESENVIMGGLNSGQTISVTLAISSPTSTQPGAEAVGSIWAKYSTSAGGPYYTQMATIKMGAI